MMDKKLQHYQEEAENGNLYACYECGNLYLQEAKCWFKKIATLDDVQAKYINHKIENIAFEVTKLQLLIKELHIINDIQVETDSKEETTERVTVLEHTLQETKHALEKLQTALDEAQEKNATLTQKLQEKEDELKQIKKSLPYNPEEQAKWEDNVDYIDLALLSQEMCDKFKAACLAYPTVGYDIEKAGRVLGTCEVAWESLKIAGVDEDNKFLAEHLPDWKFFALPDQAEELFACVKENS